MKRFFKKLFRGLWYLAWYTLAASIILIAAIFGLLRLYLPLIGEYNQDIEQYAESYAGRPIKIKSLDAEWHGFSPSLVLNDVRLLTGDGKETLLHVSRARLDFDLYEMATSKQVQFKRFGLSGTNMSLVRLPSGDFALEGFEASGIEAGQGGDGSAVVDWLLAQGEISLHASNFIFNDRMKQNRKYYFSDFSVTLRNAGNRHMIDGLLAFANEADQEFSFALDLTGNIRSAKDWSGKIFLNGSNIDIKNIFGSLPVKGSSLEIGKSSFEIWTEWQQATLTAMQGDVSLSSFEFVTDKDSLPLVDQGNQNENTQSTDHQKTVAPRRVSYENITGRFMLDRYSRGWRLQADKLSLTTEGVKWPASQLNIHQVEDETSRQTLKVQSSFVRIQDVLPLLPVLLGDNHKITKLFNQHSPVGDVGDINFQWDSRENNFELAAELYRAGTNAVGKFPGIDGLTGELYMTSDNGRFEFNTHNAGLKLPKVFRQQIRVKRANGTVFWAMNEDGLVVTSRDMLLDTNHFQSESVFDLDFTGPSDSPFISVITRIKNADASKAPLYYPYPVMGKGALKWLDRAFVNGMIVSGGAIVYGPIDEFPFTRGQGVFDVRLKAKNVTLDYSKDWPELKNADADVIFRGNSLSINSKQARIFSSSVTNISANIPDLGADVIKLDLNGTISGKTQEKLDYLLTAPELRAKYEDSLSDLRAKGNSELDLDLSLSISDEVDADAKGKLRIQDNKLELVQVPGLLNHIDGEVSFDNTIVSGKGIKANLLEQPVSVLVSTKRLANKASVIEYQAEGRFDARHIARLRFPLLSDMVDGQSDWKVRFQIPESNGSPQLIVETNLKGVSLNLPYPFKKDKPDSRKLKLSVLFHSATRSMMKISYAGNFEGFLEKNYTQEMWLTRGEVRFGGGPAVLPNEPGLRIVGDIESLSYDVWENLIQQLIDIYSRESGKPVTKKANNEKEPDPYFTLVNSVNLNVRNFEIFGQKDTNARIQMENRKTWLAFKIESDRFNGDITVPENFDEKPLVMDMNKMDIMPLEDSGGRMDPRSLPSLKLNSRSVNYGDKKLGQIAVETSRQSNGLLVQQLIIKPRDTVIKGHGAWTLEQGAENARLELVVDSKNLGNTMKDLGYVGTIADGTGTLTAKLEWPASLLDPDLYHVGGNVSFNFENGRILDIEPGGAARLFGLFSLQTLPRRLTLDFSDLFSKGLKFDIIKGDFNLENGDAYTSNMQLLGPNADVLLKGRIGIGAQDYDQKVRVTPKITDTTILLSIISSQPLLFLFQQLLKQDIDEAISFEYTLSGKWNNYKLTPIVKTPPTPSQPDDF